MNNVVIHQDAIDKLAEHPNILRFVENLAEEKAKEITAAAQKSVQDYFVGAATGVEEDVGYQLQTAGSATIGIVDGYSGDEAKNSKSQRIGNNPDLFPKWLRVAVEAAGFRPV